jgi:hypothetical protein
VERWRIYYGDGAVVSDADSTAYGVSALDVQMIAVADPEHGWYLCRSCDYYWYYPETDTWGCGEQFGLWDYLTQPGAKRVLFGRTISNAAFEAILTRAYEDWNKHGWRPRERESAGLA